MFAYVDDILIFSTSESEQLHHIIQVLQRLNEYIDFLGLRISAPLPSKVEAVKNFPIPNKSKQLQRFLGMVNYYKKMHSKERQHTAKWSRPASFPQMQKRCLLTYPNTSAEISLYTDASDVPIDAVLQQVKNGVPKPTAFFSTKLSQAEKKYSVYDQELLGIYRAIIYFK